MRMSTNRDGDFRVGGSDQRSLRVYAGAGGDSCVNMRASLQVTADVCDRTGPLYQTVGSLNRLSMASSDLLSLLPVIL